MGASSWLLLLFLRGTHKCMSLLILMSELAERCCHACPCDLFFRPLLLLMMHLCVIVRSHGYRHLKISFGHHLTTFLLCLVDVGVGICRVLTSIVVLLHLPLLLLQLLLLLLLMVIILCSLPFLYHYRLGIKWKDIWTILWSSPWTSY